MEKLVLGGYGIWYSGIEKLDLRLRQDLVEDLSDPRLILSCNSSGELSDDVCNLFVRVCGYFSDEYLRVPRLFKVLSCDLKLLKELFSLSNAAENYVDVLVRC